MASETNTLPHVQGQAPADLLKFIAYKKIAANFEEAVNLILGKKLVLGEPIVVPFTYTHSVIDASTGQAKKTIELAFGIGSADADHPYINCSMNNGIANDAVIVNADGTKSTLKHVLDQMITQESVDAAIVQAIQNAGIVDTIASNVINSDTFQEQLQEQINTVTDLLKWKSFPSPTD